MRNEGKPVKVSSRKQTYVLINDKLILKKNATKKAVVFKTHCLIRFNLLFYFTLRHCSALIYLLLFSLSSEMYKY